MRRNLLLIILVLSVGLIVMELLSNEMNKNDPGIDKKLVDSLFSNTAFKSSIGKLKSYTIDYQHLNNSDSVLEFQLKIQGEKRDTFLQGRAYRIKNNWQINN